MNNIWSEGVQGIRTLDLSRELRFRDEFKGKIIASLGLEKGMTIVDIGCGPGTLTRKLARWLGEGTQIIGIDRDTNFIKYARNKAEAEGLKNIRYMNGDALNLPLANGSVDACVSHTVIEHVPNQEFLKEQKRVCKVGGTVAVMSCRPDKYINAASELLPKPTAEEEKLWESIDALVKSNDKGYSVGEYWMDPIEFPRLFDSLGFGNIKMDMMTFPLMLDDESYTLEEKFAFIDADKCSGLDFIEMGKNHYDNGDHDGDFAKLAKFVEERSEKHKAMVREGVKTWDYQIVMTLVARGKNI